MAVVHISRVEAATNFEGLMTRAANGDAIHIESEARIIAKLLPGDAPMPRLLSESLKILDPAPGTRRRVPARGCTRTC